MLKTLFWICVAIVGAFLAYVAMLPPVGTVSRSAVLAAPPDAIFANINDLKKWDGWSPWAKLDPEAKMTYAGPESGTGASMSWSGNNEVGEGTLTIVESKPAEAVRYKLDFVKPMTATSSAELSLKPEGAGTNVTWSMTSERSFFERALCVLFQADRMVGEMFDKGLAKLGEVSAAAPQTAG